MAHGGISDAGENYVFWKLRARLPVFRDGPILTGGSYKVFVRYVCHFQRQSGARLHVLVAMMNNVAHHTRVRRCLQKKRCSSVDHAMVEMGGWGGGGVNDVRC